MTIIYSLSLSLSGCWMDTCMMHGWMDDGWTLDGWMDAENEKDRDRDNMNVIKQREGED